MSKELFVSTSPHETKVAVLEDDQLVEVYYERDTNVGLVGGIYKGRVSRVLPGMQSAFVDIGLERDAFLYVSDFFLEDQEEYDKIFEEAEARVGRGASEGASTPAPEAAQAARPTSEASAETVAASPSPETTEATSAAAEFSQAASTPAEAPSTPPTPNATAAPPPVRPAGESQHRPVRGEASDYQRSEYRGPRRRRRGRGYGDRRLPPRRDFSPPRSDTPRPPTFEVLPGESLAKYTHVTSEGPSSTASAAPSSEPEPTDAAAQWRSEAAVPSPEPSITDPSPAGLAPEDFADFQAKPTREDAREPETAVQSGSVPENPRTAHAPDWPSPPPRVKTPVEESSYTPSTQEIVAWGEVETPAEERSHTPEQPPAAAAAHVTPEPVTQPRASAFPPSGAGAAAVLPAMDSAASSGAPGSLETTLAARAQGESEAPVQTPPAGASAGPSERTYTFREPHQRPRFAPRRGRRGPRGAGYNRPPEGRRETPRPGNHQPRAIAELLKEGQEILVQIAKEPLGTKGARITSHIALPGRYVVYMPTINHIGVSRKISTEEERLRLRNIILDNKGSLTGGFIVRTAGGGRSEEELKADLKFLGTLWSEIRAKTEQAKPPALLHRDLDLLQRILRDVLSPDFKSVRVDTEVDYERALDFVNRCQPSLVGAVKLYTRDTPLFEEFGVQAEIEKALKPKVWLKSGGYIVINQTEALVAIDVNTGKYVGKTNRLEDTILKTNIDAVKEIVRQVRLRDLGGIIVIDFIDMDERRNRIKVVQALEEALRHDRAPTKIVSFNDFGLVAITRKRVKQSLERTLCEPCQYCSGAGWIKSSATVCYEILAEVRKIAKQIEGNVLTLRVNPEVAHALKSCDGVFIVEMESLTHKEIVIKGDPTVHQERFEIF